MDDSGVLSIINGVTGRNQPSTAALPAVLSQAAQSGTTPDQEAEWQRLAKESNVPVGLIRNGAPVKLMQLQQQANELPATNPVTAQTLMNPDNAAVAHDDIGTLARLEDLAKNGFGGQGNAPVSTLQFGTARDKAEANYFGTEYGTKPFQAIQGGTGKLATKLAFPVAAAVDAVNGNDDYKEFASQLYDKFSAIQKQSAASPEQGFGGKLFRSLEELAPMVLSGGAGLGNIVGQAVNEKYDDLTARGVDPDTATALALKAGMSAYAMTKLPFGGSSLTNSLVRGATLNPAFGILDRALDKAGLNYVGYNKQADDINLMDPETIAHDMALGLVFGAQHAVETGRPIVGNSVLETLLPFYDHYQAGRRADTLREIGDTVQASKLNNRDSDLLQQHLQQVGEENGIDQVYVPVNRWNTLFQDAGMDPARAADSFLSNPEAYHEAMKTGADIPIPYGEYTGKLSGLTDVYPELVKDTRLGIGDATLREAEQAKQALADQTGQGAGILDALKGVIGKSVDETTKSDSSAKIFDDVLGQQLQTGTERSQAETNARLMSNTFRVLGERAGVDPYELYREYNLKLTGPDQVQGPVNDFAGNGIRDLYRQTPHDFVKNTEGRYVFGEIPPEIGRAIGRESAPILLRTGDGTKGLSHIEERHKADYEALGYNSAVEFVDDIIRHVGAVYQAKGGALDLVVTSGKLKFARVQLEPHEGGSYYDIKTATPGRSDQYNNKQPLWENAGPSASTDENQSPLIPGANAAAFETILRQDNQNVKLEPHSGVKTLHQSAVNHLAADGVTELYQSGKQPLSPEQLSSALADKVRNSLDLANKTISDQDVEDFGDELPHDRDALLEILQNLIFPELEDLDVKPSPGGISPDTSETTPKTDEHGTGAVADSGRKKAASSAARFSGDDHVTKVVTGAIHSAITKIKSPADAAHIAFPLAKRAQEATIAIVTDVKGNVLGVVQHSTGALDSTISSPRDLLGVVHDFPGAAEVWFAHNHPSGDPSPSFADKKVVKHLASLLDGSGMKSRGEVVVGQKGGAVWIDATGGTTERIPLGALNLDKDRTKKIKTYDREIIKLPSSDPLIFKKQTVDYARSLGPGATGVIIVDTKLRPVSFVSMSVDEMARLKTGDPATGSSSIMSAFHKANGMGMIMVAPVIPDRHAALRNMSSFGKIFGGRLFDIIETKSGRSFDKNGIMPEGSDQFFQGDADKRGYIRFDTNRNFEIGLLKDADLSTFIHESGHFFTEVLGDLAERPNAPQQIKDDYATLLKFAGVDSRDAIRTEHHEKLARAFEEYIMEGQAPSVETRGIFQRMKAWMIGVYKDLIALNVTLNPEVREVFDRMAATDTEIGRMRDLEDNRPLFASTLDAYGSSLLHAPGYETGRNARMAPMEGNGFNRADVNNLAGNGVREVRQDGATPSPEELMRKYGTAEHSSFGPVWRDLAHNDKGAIERLVQHRTGEAIGALHHPEVGDIDLVWGKEGTSEKEHLDGYGLAKIMVKHPDVVGNLQKILSEMIVAKRSNNRIVLESADHHAVVRLDWDGKDKQWLLTEYKNDQEIGTGERTGVPSITEQDSPVHQSLVDIIFQQSESDVKRGFTRFDNNSKEESGKSLMAPVEGKGFNQAAVNHLAADGVRELYQSGDEQVSRDFVKNSEGKYAFGEITPDIGKAIRREAAPILLRSGNAEEGLRHIEDRHGKEIAAAGYGSVPGFVQEVATGFDSIYKGRGATLAVVKRSDGNKLLYAELEPGKHGAFYDVKSAMLVRPDFLKNKELLWERAQSDQTVSGPPSAISGQSSSFDTILHQNREDVKRGSIRFDNNRNFEIGLLKDADLSTFIHESGHFFTEVLGDLAKRADAPQQSKDDYAALLKFGGADSRDARQTGHHEKLARAFEAYIREGSAPRVDLHSVFQRMKAWMISVYKDMTALRVQLNPEVRDVFDPMVASDTEIRRMRDMEEMKPVFATAADAGMSQAEFERYRKDAEQAGELAKEQLLRKLLAEKDREQKSWWKDERKKTWSKVEAEAKNNPVYQTYQALTSGKTSDGRGAGDIKLSRAALVKRYGESFVKTLPREFQRIYSKEGGLHPDVVAEMAGFGSGDEMVRKLAAAPRLKEYVKAETDRRMRERHGDMMTDGSIHEQAMKEVYNDAQGKVMRAELLAIRRKAKEAKPFVDTAGTEGVADADATARWYTAEGRAQDAQYRAQRDAILGAIPPMEFFKIAASEAMDAKRVGEIQPNLYAHAARAAARDSFKAAAQGNFEKSGEAKYRELLNHYLYKEAAKAQDFVDKVQAYATRMGALEEPGAFGQTGGQFLDQIHAILDRYGFERTGNKEADEHMPYRESLDAFLLRMNGEEGVVLPIPDYVRQEVQRTTYRNLSMDELRGVYHSMRMLEHAARQVNQVTAEGRKVEVTKAALSLSNRLFRSIKGVVDMVRKSDGAVALMDRVKDINLDIPVLLPEFMFKRFDGLKKTGSWHEFIWDRYNDAVDHQVGLREQLFPRIMKYAHDTAIDRSMGKIRIDSLNADLVKDDIIAIALNCGNGGNLDKLMLGGLHFTGDEAPHILNHEALQEILSHLSAQEIDVVNGIWNAIDLLKPEAAGLTHKRAGIEPDWIEAQPMQVRNGTLEGGYYPVKYNAHYSVGGEKQSDPSTLDQMFNKYAAGSTRQVNMDGRSSFAVPLSLDWQSIVSRDLDEVITEISHWQFATDTQRLLKRPEIKDAIHERLGAAYYKNLLDWVRYAVNQDNVSPEASDSIEKFRRAIRGNMSTYALGVKVADAVNGMASGGPLMTQQVKIASVFKGIMQYLRNPVEATRFATQASDYMRNIGKSFDQEISQALNALAGRHTVEDDICRWSMAARTYLGKIGAVMAWHAGYIDAQEQGMQGKAAVRIADSICRMTQEPGRGGEASAVQRDTYVKELARFIGPRMKDYLDRDGLSPERYDEQKAQEWLAVLQPTVSDRIAKVLKPSENIRPFSNEAVKQSGEQVFYQSVSDARDRIATVIDSTDMHPEGHVSSDIVAVDTWLSDIAKENGLDIAGYRHSIDNSAVRHILKKHGDENTEISRGQLPITRDDILNIPVLVSSPDKVVFGSKTKQGRDEVVFLKRMEDGSILYLEEVRTGKKNLAAVSMRKYPATTRAGSILSSLGPNVRNDGGVSNLNIVESPVSVKANDSNFQIGLATLLAGYVANTMISGMMCGKRPDKLDKLSSWILARLTLGLFDGFPLIRDVAGYADGGTTSGKGREMRPLPVLQWGKDAVDGFTKTVEAITDDGEWNNAVIRYAKAEGRATGAPALAGSTAGHYIHDVLSGDYKPDHPWPPMTGIFHNRTRK